MALKEALRRFLGDPECHKLILYDTRTITFKSLGAGYGEATFSLGEFQTEVNEIRAASDLAMALDDYQYDMCTSLRSLRRDDPDWKRNYNWRWAVVTQLTGLRGTLEVFKVDPSGQRENLHKAVKDMNDLLRKIREELMGERPAADKRTKAPKAVEGKTGKAISSTSTLRVFDLPSGARVSTGGPIGVRFEVPDKRPHYQYAPYFGRRAVSKEYFKKRYPHDYYDLAAELYSPKPKKIKSH
jgi:hypothetical protein